MSDFSKIEGITLFHPWNSALSASLPKRTTSKDMNQGLRLWQEKAIEYIYSFKISHPEGRRG